ncbi:amino acid-binding protein [Sinomonas sp. ASV322]|uniref:amino acid-binding protein n=1 Tax=Sinomonas sp. ASV322 TaxID=3041920 RepID=UPI0027DDF751|nr:amino acid-binding protein [Sinomonas sp. ASV322]MDQ4502588.1 amino acid-binding protein [Sinomonas sp. ASV322]
MDTQRTTPTVAHPDLACEVCGRYPEPPKARLTLANVAAMLPIELAVHVAVVGTEWPVPLKVVLLAALTTTLVIWVAEPSVRRLLRSWLHAPALRRRRELEVAPSLWRGRVTLPDMPGALEKVTRSLAKLGVNVLSIQSQPVTGGVVDALVLSAPGGLTEDDLLDAMAIGGGAAPRVWPTTPLALVDGPTQALSLATRVAANPSELPYAAAELLGAERVPANSSLDAAAVARGTVLKVPATPEPLVLVRPGEPFTPAEAARASRLAELAEAAALRA